METMRKLFEPPITPSDIKMVKDKEPMILPKHFEWVYVYVDIKTKRVGYVGRAKTARNCELRMFDHRAEEWYSSGEWAVGFIPAINRFESEYIEGVLIQEYDAKWNKDKKDWGLFVDKQHDYLSEATFVLDYNIHKNILAGTLEEAEARYSEAMKNHGWQ